ncbi:MAG: futalosine hydrolase [Acidobacteriota bacterium]
MRILIVAATEWEIAPIVPALGCRSSDIPRMKTYVYGGHEIDALTTGVGMVATAAWCSRVLAERQYDLGLNFGLCGSFDRALAPERVVHVVRDRIAELGAEDGDAFLTIQELNLLGRDEFPFVAGQLLNPRPPANEALHGLPAVAGITVNTVHGAERSIAAAAERFDPQVESMEGAAFMYACLIHGLDFAQVRAVSNFVERRNRGAWKITSAIDALGRAARSILDHA